MKPVAYSYIRMSTQAQLRGDSLRRQRELSQRYADDHGLHLVDDLNLEDIGVSAFHGANVEDGALGRFLHAVEIGRVPQGAYLLVESLDRVSRQRIAAAASLFLGITAAGINLVTLADGQVYRAGECDFGQLIVAMTVLYRAHEESRIKSDRLGAAWRQKRALAADKKLTRIAPKWLQLTDDGQKFVCVADRVAVVRRIFEDAIAGMGTYSIVKSLNAQAVPSFGRSKYWAQSSVRKILQNRAVLGECQPHKLINGKRQPEGPVIQGYYPRIVEDEVFLHAQHLRQSRGRTSGGRKGRAFSNLFTHLAKCFQCGSPMHFVNKGPGPKGGQYLICSLARRGQCGSTSWRYPDFETTFLLFAEQIDLVSSFEGSDRIAAKRQEAKNAIEGRLRQAEFTRERILDLLGDGSVAVETIRARLLDAERQVDEARDQLAAVQSDQRSASRLHENRSQILSLIRQIQQGEQRFSTRQSLANHIQGLVTDIRVGCIRSDISAGDDHKPGRASIERFFEVSFIDGWVQRLVAAPGKPAEFQIIEITNGSGATFSFSYGSNLVILSQRVGPPQLEADASHISAAAV